MLPLAAKAGLGAWQRRKLTARWPRPARFDRNLVVIGAGSAGLVSAYIAAAVKAKVTLVERDRMGGDCLNTGCVPSKALIRTARLVSDIGRAAELGLRDARAEVDFAAAMERVQRVIAEIEPHDSPERYEGLGVEVLAGEARIATPWEVEITAADGTVRRLSTRSIVIATGAEPTLPDLPGLAESGFLTSDTIWSLRRLPARLLVLGGGPIGCELTQAFARLGSKVTQVEWGDRLLSREDDDVGDLVTRQFLAEGVDLRLGHRALRFERHADDRVLVAEHAGEEVRLPYDQVLVAVGRSARLKGFGLEALGIDTDKTVETNAFLQTSLPHIYAAGDVAGPYQFTHVAAHQAWYATVNALFDPFKKFRADYRVIPAATFVEPEVARVGLNVREAEDEKVAHEVTTYRIAELDRAIADGEARGFVKILTVPGKDRILGVTIVGEHAADLLAEFVAGDEARHRARQDPRHDPHLPDDVGGQQVGGRRLAARAPAEDAAGAGGAVPCLAPWLASAPAPMAAKAPPSRSSWSCRSWTRRPPWPLGCRRCSRCAGAACASSSPMAAAATAASRSRRALSDRAVRCERGRARQMNAGAAALPFRVVLFLHADTALPDDADRLVLDAVAAGPGVGPLRRADRQRPTHAAAGGGADEPAFAAHRHRHRRPGPVHERRGVSRGRRIPDAAADGRHRDVAPPEADRAARLPAPACRDLGAALGKRRRLAHGLADVAPACRLLARRRSRAAGPALRPRSRRTAMRTPPDRVDIAVMAKAPIAGFAKTRLIGALGAAAAARLHRRLAIQAARTAVAAGLGEVTLWCAPDPAHRFFRALAAGLGVGARAQPAGDLGERMLAAFAAQPAGIPLALIGTDCPALAATHLQAAADALLRRPRRHLDARRGRRLRADRPAPGAAGALSRHRLGHGPGDGADARARPGAGAAVA